MAWRMAVERMEAIMLLAAGPSMVYATNQFPILSEVRTNRIL